jgi:hypothetical protein
LSIELGDIVDAILSGERLLLAMEDGQGASLSVSQPRLLRVEMAATRGSATG